MYLQLQDGPLPAPLAGPAALGVVRWVRVLALALPSGRRPLERSLDLKRAKSIPCLSLLGKSLSATRDIARIQHTTSFTRCVDLLQRST